MSFLRRLFGGDGRDDGHDAEDDDDARPALPPPPTPPELGSRTYLEFIGGSAAKFYAALIERDETDTWRVPFTFGRIGSSRDWATKVDGVSETQAHRVYADLIGEKLRKGYEIRPWPYDLALPGGERVEEAPGSTGSTTRGIYVAARPGDLPRGAGVIAGVALPDGRLFSPADDGGPRGGAPVLWVSHRPVKDVAAAWTGMARAFPTTGLWPLVIDAEDADAMDERLIDIPRSTGADPFQLLRRWWHENVAPDEDEFDDEATSPFGRKFPGLAPRSPGERPASVEAYIRDLTGHLGLVAVERPARVLDAIAWMGLANYDMNPNEQSAILDTWEDRFDAYLVGLGSDTITLAVGRPPRDLAAALPIAAEHLAFCSDNIYQGVGSIAEYAPMLVKEHRWDFWWD